MSEYGNTEMLLLQHYQKYPELQMQDIFKYLYQSSFGCEHMVPSFDIAKAYLDEELRTIEAVKDVEPEMLDGGFGRIPLAYLREGMEIDTFAKLFCLSARKVSDGMEALLQKLKVVYKMVEEHKLPFSMEMFLEAVDKWAAKGYCAIHHSDVFRELYKPSYRVIAKEYIIFLPLLTELDKRLKEGRVILAIEGGSASGKSTLGKLLSDIYDCTLFHMDDFFLQPAQRTKERYAELGGNVDWERFLEEVLMPLHSGDTICYRRFDCSSMCMMEGIEMKPQKLVVIEGAYSMHPELAQYYDFSVFLDVSTGCQKERIMKRNSPDFAKRFFEEWIPMEEAYFTGMHIKERCDMQICIGK